MLVVGKLRSLLDGNEPVVEYNGVVFKNDGSGITISATGLFTPPVSFALNGTQLRLLRNFLDLPLNNKLVHIFKRKNGIRLVLDWSDEWHTALDLLEDGTSVVHEHWDSMNWDRWTVSPDGVVRYVGDLDGYRKVPEWVMKR